MSFFDGSKFLKSDKRKPLLFETRRFFFVKLHTVCHKWQNVATRKNMYLSK